ncbi:MAG TPA: gamma-glutamyltransferase [Thermoanaerobaculia bacterium]|nr:gamma-glutamyltransferase [Thermoanaerobaculia bacterium]
MAGSRRILSCLLVFWAIWPVQAASPPPLAGTGGAVVSDDPLATEVGLEILRRGGNAVDAAVATALALAVTYPEAGNLGGGGFAVVKWGAEVAALDFREVAPAAASERMYLDERGEPIPDASLIGPLAAGVPGSPAGLAELHRRYGSLPWREVVTPARRLASEGFAVRRQLTDQIERNRALLARFPESAATWLPGGQAPAPGSILRQPELGATLARWAESGGLTALSEVARRVEEDSRLLGGILRADEILRYQPVWREPLRFTAFGWQVATMPLPSSGGVIFAQTARLLESFGWQAAPRFGADRAHGLAEALRRAFAARYRLGDPETSELSPAELLAAPSLASLAASYSRERATPSESLRPAVAALGESQDTTHLAVIDGQGRIVSLTTTLNALFGCGLYVPGFGFLNNEMDDFATAPGRPNLFGLVQGEANAVRPGRRMLSSMSPTVAWRSAGEGKEEEALAVGGRGGSRIASHVVQVLLNVLADGDSIQAALDRPRLHHQWLPDQLEAELDALSPETRAELERRGHRLVSATSTARVHALARRPDGTLEAAVEPRGTGRAGVVALLPGELP